MSTNSRDEQHDAVLRVDAVEQALVRNLAQQLDDGGAAVVPLE